MGCELYKHHVGGGLRISTVNWRFCNRAPGCKCTRQEAEILGKKVVGLGRKEGADERYVCSQIWVEILYVLKEYMVVVPWSMEKAFNSMEDRRKEVRILGERVLGELKIGW